MTSSDRTAFVLRVLQRDRAGPVLGPDGFLRARHGRGGQFGPGQPVHHPDPPVRRVSISSPQSLQEGCLVDQTPHPATMQLPPREHLHHRTSPTSPGSAFPRLSRARELTAGASPCADLRFHSGGGVLVPVDLLPYCEPARGVSLGSDRGEDRPARWVRVKTGCEGGRWRGGEEWH